MEMFVTTYNILIQNLFFILWIFSKFIGQYCRKYNKTYVNNIYVIDFICKIFIIVFDNGANSHSNLINVDTKSIYLKFT